ncbi:MAG: hypothetical protein K2K72_02730 [Duncaniella sp.]|nr:hypothetical protein [Duncaniella sp.]
MTHTIHTSLLPRLFSLLTALLLAVPSLRAVCPVGEEEPVSDAEEQQMLASGVTASAADEDDDINIPIPSFIKTSANHIILNGSDWSRLRRAVGRSSSEPVSIIHIGDSHIQADMSTSTTRELLQYDYGDAGRGLVAPLKMSGTNQPLDYTFQSHGSWTPAKLMSSNWRHTMGFTGTSIRPVTSTSSLTIATGGRDDYEPFSSLTLFHNGKLTVKDVKGDEGSTLNVRVIPSRDYTQIILPEPQTSVIINFASAGDLTVYGASLSGDRPGLFYHTIGNNGATYETYNRIGNVGAGIAPLNPSLVIISLGTNEAFGKLDQAAFVRSIDRLVNIRAANPKALIMLTTPMECHRSVTTTRKVKVRSKGKNGRKGRLRTVNRTSRTYTVNNNIAPLRTTILDYARRNSLPVWDWYEVAGGKGASTQWISNNLFAGDRVHHTTRGYNLEGRLLYDALSEALRQ